MSILTYLVESIAIFLFSVTYDFALNAIGVGKSGDLISTETGSLF